jgi:hypothetical protein
LFPHIRKYFKEKSSIPRSLLRGFFIFTMTKSMTKLPGRGGKRRKVDAVFDLDGILRGIRKAELDSGEHHPE